MSDSDLNNLLSSQEYSYLRDDLNVDEILNGNMDILADIPEQYNHLPSNEDYPGSYGFEFHVDPNPRKSWIYSSVLNKIFIISNTNFPVDFKWNQPSNRPEFFIRAMPLYSLPSEVSRPVKRCIQHQQESDPTNAGLNSLERMHIMRCGSTLAKFEGGPIGHFSVVTPLDQQAAGIDRVKQLFTFVCKNSCPTGMNRRPIEVVFTLEDRNEKVLGRRKVNVRICSCPKRDMEKEEEEFHKKKNGFPPKNKKRKVMSKKPTSFNDSNDTEKYQVTFNIIGKQNFKAVIKYAQLLMANEMHRSGNKEPHEACYNELDTILNQS